MQHVVTPVDVKSEVLDVRSRVSRMQEREEEEGETHPSGQV